jgi:hypothetical protein
LWVHPCKRTDDGFLSIGTIEHDDIDALAFLRETEILRGVDAFAFIESTI